MTNQEKFKGIYEEELGVEVTTHSEKHPWLHKPGKTGFGKKTIAEVVDNMITALREKRMNKDTPALKRTCRRVGIKHTYRAIQEYLKCSG